MTSQRISRCEYKLPILKNQFDKSNKNKTLTLSFLHTMQRTPKPLTLFENKDEVIVSHKVKHQQMATMPESQFITNSVQLCLWIQTCEYLSISSSSLFLENQKQKQAIYNTQLWGGKNTCIHEDTEKRKQTNSYL